MKARYVLFQHTADIGIQVTAQDLPQLFETAAKALYSVFGQIETLDAQAAVSEFQFEEEDPAALLRAFLAELLFYFETKAWAAASFQFLELQQNRLRAKAVMHSLDRDRSVFFAEVKAITYHGLSVEKKESADGSYLEARVILDI